MTNAEKYAKSPAMLISIIKETNCSECQLRPYCLIQTPYGKMTNGTCCETKAAWLAEEVNEPKDNGWRSASAPPKDNSPVLCWYEYYHWSKGKVLPEYGVGYYLPQTERWGGEVTSGRNAKVLYWMPLPAPPEEEK